MTTLSGGPRKTDFQDGDILTASGFNEATQFWLADELPTDEEGNDGDVVFVVGDSAGGAPGAAVIGDATGAVTTSSFTGNGTNGDAGQAYDVYEFSGVGTLNVDTDGDGVASLFMLAGGGGGSGSGAGAGGLIEDDVHLTAGAYTVAVGGGGAPSAPGGVSSFGRGTNKSIYAVGGGQGTIAWQAGAPGGCGGGAAGGAGGPVLYEQGNPGGGGQGPGFYNGGGGQGSAGEPNNEAGRGGSGISSVFTGEPVSRAAGGGAASTINGSLWTGVAHSGDGGFNGVAGHSGVVILRVKVDSPSFPSKTRSTAPKTAHAARIEDGIVRQVIVIPHLDDDDTKITQYCNSIGLPGTWVDTSYTGSRRGKYAGVGDLFDLNTRNAEFISPAVEEEDNG